MYRAVLCFALLAFCSGAPYGDFSSSRNIAQQPSSVVRVQQQDQTDLVDTLGAGYSYFKKQPIVSRPLVQQRLAVSEQQVPMTSFADSSNQWSDYTKASAFSQPAQTQTFTTGNDLLASGGYGQQQSLSGGLGSQQDSTNLQTNLITQSFPSQQQNGYGSSFSQSQPQTVLQTQPLVRNLGSSYAQQQQDVQQPVQQQQPTVSNFGSSYSQQQQQQQPIVRNLGSTYSQQQQDVQQLVQQQQPVVSNYVNPYGQQQQQQDVQQLVQQQPIVSNFGNSYSQQQQQQPIVRNLGNTYDQQQQDVQTFVQQQQPTVSNFGSSYNQQQQQQQPIVRNLGNTYDQQQQQDVQTLVQQQPIVRNLGNTYSQQQPIVRNLGNTYSQQQPIVRSFGNPYGQQQQQPAFSQQADFSSGSSLRMPVARFASQSQPLVQTAGNSPYRR